MIQQTGLCKRIAYPDFEESPTIARRGAISELPPSDAGWDVGLPSVARTLGEEILHPYVPWFVILTRYDIDFGSPRTNHDQEAQLGLGCDNDSSSPFGLRAVERTTCSLAPTEGNLD